MKIAFWFIGASCSGKSHYARTTAKKLGVDWISLDTIEDKIKLDKMSRSDGYDFLFRRKNDIIVVDGIVPFNFPIDMDMVQQRLRGYEIIFVLVKPEYEQWVRNCEYRRKEVPGSNPSHFTKDEYDKYNYALASRVSRHLVIKKESDIDIISEEQIRNLNYQHEGFTDVKFQQLSIPCAGKTVLDLGCSSCQFEPLIMAAGATRYHGLDVNFAYLIRKNAELFNINNLEIWQEKFDVVICSSVMHYIHDKEKFIKECARIANEVCVLEIPLDRAEGKELCLGSRGLYFPTKGLFEHWVEKYFSSFECLGESIVEDGSYRLIYHCKK